MSKKVEYDLDVDFTMRFHPHENASVGNESDTLSLFKYKNIGQCIHVIGRVNVLISSYILSLNLTH